MVSMCIAHWSKYVLVLVLFCCIPSSKTSTFNKYKDWGMPGLAQVAT